MWERVGRELTIYGGGKVNVNTATEPVLTGLLMAYYNGVATELTVKPTVDELIKARGAPGRRRRAVLRVRQALLHDDHERRTTDPDAEPQARDPAGDHDHVDVFRVTSVGEVGDARTEIHAVYGLLERPHRPHRLLEMEIRCPV